MTNIKTYSYLTLLSQLSLLFAHCWWMRPVTFVAWASQWLKCHQRSNLHLDWYVWVFFWEQVNMCHCSACSGIGHIQWDFLSPFVVFFERYLRFVLNHYLSRDRVEFLAYRNKCLCHIKYIFIESVVNVLLILIYLLHIHSIYIILYM